MGGRNWPPEAPLPLREIERAIAMQQPQDMIRKERPGVQGAEEAWGGCGSSGHGRHVSGVKVFFAAVW